MVLRRGVSRAVLLGVVACAGITESRPGAVVRMVDRVEVRVRPITAEALDPSKLPLTLRPGDEEVAEGELIVRWPGPDDRTTVRLRARERLLTDDDRRSVLVEAEVFPPDGERTVAQRVVSFASSETALFEVHRARETGLTLAIECETVREIVAATHRTVGTPVSFRLEVSWVDGAEVVLLETNRLDSFVGDPVTYAFAFDEDASARSMEVRIEPLRLVGSVLQYQVEVTGNLPAATTPRFVARKERWLTSAGARSSLDMVEGDPPKGYRFSVTPTFEVSGVP